jgi:competence protein ComEC
MWMQGRPLLLFVLCWIVGSSTACLYSGISLIGIWVGMTVILLASMALIRVRWKVIIIVWIAITLSGGYWEWHDQSNVTSLPDAIHQDVIVLEGMTVEAEGMIVTKVDVDGNRADMNVELSGLNDSVVSETILVQVKLETKEQQQEALKWRRGDDMKMKGILEFPTTATNYDGFDYRNYLRSKEVHWILKVIGLQNIEATPPSSWSIESIFRWNDAFREQMATKIDELFQEPHAGYMKGLIIGMQDDVDPITYNQFSQLGLTHILAVSGTHVAVYVACLLILLSLFRLSRETTLTIVILLVPCYVLLTGFSPSVVRSGIMSMIALYAARQGLLKDGLHIISAAALIMLIWNPYLLINVSFQLSFIVTLGLIVYVPLMIPLLSKLPRKFASALGVTVIAQLTSFPLTIYYFNQFSLLSLFANLLLVPLISFFVMPLGMIALVLGSIWLPVGRYIAWIAERIDNVTFAIVEWMNMHSAFITIWPSPSILWICCYYIIVYLLLRLGNVWVKEAELPPISFDDTIPLDGVYGYNHQHVDVREVGSNKLTWRQFIVAPVMLIFVALLYVGYQPKSLNGAGLVSFLDVGQGDCILITTPEGKHILVDGGGTVNFRKQEDDWKNRQNPFEVGAKVVVPLLKKRGVHYLDAVVLTHGDQDHTGGLQAVLDQIPVKALLFNGTITGTDTLEKLLSTALAKDIPIYAIHNTMVMQPDKYSEITFLAPEIIQDELPIVEEQNHSSLVFILEMNGVRVLMTGDMDEASEMNILRDEANTTTVFKGVDIIKIAHHGSKTSTSEDWLTRWKASVAVISVGVNNTYGHPNSGVVDRIIEQGIRIFRTDEQGEIQMKLADHHVWVRNKLN